MAQGIGKQLDEPKILEKSKKVQYIFSELSIHMLPIQLIILIGLTNYTAYNKWTERSGVIEIHMKKGG